jgi:hypothetical protein
MSLNQIMKNEPKELAQFASDAYHVGVQDALAYVRQRFPLQTNPNISDAQLVEILDELLAQAFHAVEWRRNVEWIEGIDHSLSPSKTYISMPIERYRELTGKE